MAKIFISYRRIDQDITGRIYDRLVQAFGHDNVFKDVDNIPFGVDFRKAITDAVHCSDALLVIIGNEWIRSVDDSGRRRLEDPQDFVRIEVEAALEREIPILPVLTHDASHPKAGELPASLHELVYRNMARIRPDPDFAVDVERVCMSVKSLTGSEDDETPGQDGFAFPAITAELGPNPYRGLNAFDVEDADLFFGREVQVDRVIARLRELSPDSDQQECRLIGLLGPSGNGKSSVARAGVVSRICQVEASGEMVMSASVMTPKSRPLETLANHLARLITGDAAPLTKSEEFLQSLEKKSHRGTFEGLRRIADMCAGVLGKRLLLVIDQFEELYTLCQDEAERVAFIENLIHACHDQAGNLTVLLTLRSDFLSETQNHSHLDHVIAEHGILIPTMSEDDLRQVITEPARQAGYEFESGLVDLLVHETLDRDGALPLLQFALTRIWEGLLNNRTPSETLKQIGGVGGCLASVAQDIYDSLSTEEKNIARRLFTSLVQLGEGAEDTRRRVVLAQVLGRADDPALVRKVIERFSRPDARLITVSGKDDTTREEVVEITHEALIKHWQLLRQWLDEGRERIRFLRRLDDAVSHWNSEGRPNGLLWRPPVLGLLAQFHKTYPKELRTEHVDFYQASRKLDRFQWVLRFVVMAAFCVVVSGSVIAVFHVKYRTQREEDRRAVLRDEIENLASSPIVAAENVRKLNQSLAKLEKLSSTDYESFKKSFDSSLRVWTNELLEIRYLTSDPIRDDLETVLAALEELRLTTLTSYDLLKDRLDILSTSMVTPDVSTVLREHLRTDRLPGAYRGYTTPRGSEYTSVRLTNGQVGSEFLLRLRIQSLDVSQFAVEFTQQHDNSRQTTMFSIAPPSDVLQPGAAMARIREDETVIQDLALDMQSGIIELMISCRNGILTFNIGDHQLKHQSLFFNRLAAGDLILHVPMGVVILDDISLRYRARQQADASLSDGAEAFAAIGDYETALSIYKQLLAEAKTERAKQSICLKSALCELRLKDDVGEANEVAEAVDKLMEIAAGPDIDLSVPAAAALLRNSIQTEAVAETEALLTRFITPLPTSEVKKRIPPQLWDDAHAEIAKYSTVPARLQLEQNQMHYLETLLEISKYGPSADNARATLNVALGRLHRDEFEQGRKLLEHILTNVHYMPSGIWMAAFDHYCSLSILTNRSVETLRFAEKQRTSLSLSPELENRLLLDIVRLHRANGDVESAKQTLERIRQSQSSTSASVKAECLLMYGLLLAEGGDEEAAADAWKKGFDLVRDGTGKANVVYLMLGSLSEQLSDQDVLQSFQENREIAGDRFEIASLLIEKMSKGIFPEVYRAVKEMYRKGRGREYALKIAFQDMSFSDRLTAQARLGIYYTLFHGAFASNPGPHDDQYLWDFAGAGIERWRRRELNNLPTILLSWFPVTANLSFGRISEPTKQEFGYFLGCRHLNQHGADGQRSFFSGLAGTDDLSRAEKYFSAAAETDDERLRKLAKGKLQEVGQLKQQQGQNN